ncbi:GNAT family N-acetyltransferase [Caballeronia sp. LjRoot34]|uniref:GNAT family N-acetyltransferase n=1 Tax=Caballeronia sp. LjRoot34 TaxID=3342325 RepID=UPI003ECE3726
MQNSDSAKSFVTLRPMSVLELEKIAGIADRDDRLSAPEMGLPPPHVARRALERIEAKQSSSWCLPFLIVGAQKLGIAGSCGFKGQPTRGEVEIGYGVTPSFQNQGIATAAVRELLKLAFADRSVSQVLATINPKNVASNRVVEKLGFERRDQFTDFDGEELVRWRLCRDGSSI